MKNFKNSKMAKAVSGFVGLTTAVMMMGPAVASAATVEELTAQINALLAQVSALQASQTTSAVTTTSGHVFSVDLTLGSKGDDVVALQTALVAGGHLVMPAGVAMGYFGGLTKAAVSAWQAASGITPTAGYFGPKSRAVMNASAPSTTTTTTTTTSTTLPAGCSSATGFSPITGVSCVTGTTAVVGGGVSASLDPASVANQTLVSPQGVATLATFKLTNGGTVPAKVTMMKFKRAGISMDSTIGNLYLYSGTARLTDASSLSSSMVNFSDSAGIVTIPAGGSVLVAIRGDVTAAQAGRALIMMLTDVTTDVGAVGGLPVSGPTNTFATAPTDMASANFSATTSIGSDIDPQNDFVVWQANLNIGNRDALVSAIRFQQIGSVYTSDIKNFRFMVDGVQVGTAVEQVDANRFVSFVFASPVTVKAGNHTVKLVADLVGGSSRNFKFSLRRVVDAEIWDGQLGVVVTPTVLSLAFVAVEPTSASTIKAGSLTITKATDSPSGNVVLNGSGVTLAKFKFRAQGEELKIETLTVGFTASLAAGTWGQVRSASIYADGVQVGSTVNMVAAGSVFNPSLILTPGKDVLVEVRGDVFDADSTNTIAASDTILVNILAGSSNVYQRASLGYISSGAMSGNTLTVAAGSLTLAKYSAYANQTVTDPQTAYKIGDFRLTTGSTEGVNLDTITLNLPNNGTTDMVPSDLTNIYVVYGTKTTTQKAAGVLGAQTFSINEAVAANSTMSFAVYADISANTLVGSTTQASLTVSGTSQSSGNAVTSLSAPTAGQTVTIGQGTLTVAVDSSSPAQTNSVANSMPKVASFRYNSSNDTFTITEIGVTVGAVGATAISELVFKDAAGTELKRVAMNGTMATATGLSVPVTYNGLKVIDVYAQLGSVGTGFATTSANVAVSHSSTKYMDSNGQTAYKNTALNGAAQYVFRSKPTITNVALPSSLLDAGLKTVAKFMVTADAGGAIAWKKLILTVASSTPSGSFQVSGYGIYDETNTLLANVTTNGSLTPGAGTTVTFVSTVDQEVSGSKTYTVKATVAGSPVTGSSLSHNIAYAAVYAAPDTYAVAAAIGTNNFVWSDQSVVGHDATTADWMGDFLVKNLPLDSATLTK